MFPMDNDEIYLTIPSEYDDVIEIYDENGHKIHLKTSKGYESWRKYDKNGNMIHYKDSDGFEIWRKFNENGKPIHYKDSDGFEFWKEYDRTGNEIHYKNSDGYEVWYEYDENGNIVIGDEMLTPDSSRFWPADTYEAGHSQPSFDKQFARDWLKDPKNEGHGWTLPQDIVDKTIEKYLQGYELITGSKLQ